MSKLKKHLNFGGLQASKVEKILNSMDLQFSNQEDLGKWRHSEARVAPRAPWNRNSTSSSFARSLLAGWAHWALGPGPWVDPGPGPWVGQGPMPWFLGGPGPWALGPWWASFSLLSSPPPSSFLTSALLPPPSVLLLATSFLLPPLTSFQRLTTILFLVFDYRIILATSRIQTRCCSRGPLATIQNHTGPNYTYIPI